MIKNFRKSCRSRSFWTTDLQIQIQLKSIYQGANTHTVILKSWRVLILGRNSCFDTRVKRYLRGNYEDAAENDRNVTRIITR